MAGACRYRARSSFLIPGFPARLPRSLRRPGKYVFHSRSWRTGGTNIVGQISWARHRGPAVRRVPSKRKSWNLAAFGTGLTSRTPCIWCQGFICPPAGGFAVRAGRSDADHDRGQFLRHLNIGILLERSLLLLAESGKQSQSSIGWSVHTLEGSCLRCPPLALLTLEHKFFRR